MDVEIETSASGADQLASLRAALDERDATIELLAQQLEEAANRLDEISRGESETRPTSFKQPSSATGSVPSPLRGETVQRLEQFLHDWEAAPLGNALDRIDRRLSHVFELLKSSDSNEPPLKREESQSPMQSTGLTTGALLSAFLNSESKSSQNADAQGGSPANGAAPSDQPKREAALEPSPPLPDFSVPKSVDVAAASIEELRIAVQERDACIQQLIARSRVAEEHRTRVPDWEALDNAPEELEAALIQLEVDLRQRIKQEELSSSIERAKISRDRVHLEQVRRELEMQIRQLGHKQNDGIEHEVDAKSNGKRWGKLFGR